MNFDYSMKITIVLKSSINKVIQKSPYSILSKNNNNENNIPHFTKIYEHFKNLQNKADMNHTTS